MLTRYRIAFVSAVALLMIGCDTSPKASSSAGLSAGDSRPLVGIHELELEEGVTEEAFEAFVRGPFKACFEQPVGGLEVRIEKCDRGLQEGNYRAVWAFDTVARRDSYFPSAGPPTASFEEEVTSKLPESWSRLWEMCNSTGYTDYVVMYSTPCPGSEDAQSLYGAHDLVLADDVTAEDFQAFVTGPFAAAWPEAVEGLGRQMLVGDRGDRVGEYQNVFVFTPAARRDQFFPTSTTQTDFFRQKVQPRIPASIGDTIRRMTVRESFSDWAPIE